MSYRFINCLLGSIYQPGWYACRAQMPIFTNTTICSTYTLITCIINQDFNQWYYNSRKYRYEIGLTSPPLPLAVDHAATACFVRQDFARCRTERGVNSACAALCTGARLLCWPVWRECHEKRRSQFVIYLMGYMHTLILITHSNNLTVAANVVLSLFSVCLLGMNWHGLDRCGLLPSSIINVIVLN